MKAIFRVTVLSGLFLLSLVFFISSQMHAQTIISIDSSFDSTVVMKIPKSNLMEYPQKLIVIIDNGIEENQLSEEEILAWLDSRQITSDPSFLEKSTAKHKMSVEAEKENLMNYLVKKTLNEDIDQEDEIETEEWMFSSENWLSNMDQ